MNHLSQKALLLLMAASVNGLAFAGDSSQAREWLERMTTAMSQMSYQGTFVYVRDEKVETMRITHLTDDNGVRERIYSVSGPHREVIRDRKGVRCVLEDSASVVEDQVVSSSYFPELPLSIIDGEASGYRLETGGEARIAGHIARRVSISPEDNFRYGYDLWLEEQTGLLLKWILLDTRLKKP
jgi:sigma-E factor negative regulatory protein RseB